MVTIPVRVSTAMLEKAARNYVGRFATSDLPDLAKALWDRVDASKNIDAVAWMSFLAAVVESEFRRRSN